VNYKFSVLALIKKWKKRAQVRKEGLEKIKSITAKYALSAEELKLLSGANSSGEHGSADPKYRDPSNTEST